MAVDPSFNTAFSVSTPQSGMEVGGTYDPADGTLFIQVWDKGIKGTPQSINAAIIWLPREDLLALSAHLKKVLKGVPA